MYIPSILMPDSKVFFVWIKSEAAANWSGHCYCAQPQIAPLQSWLQHEINLSILNPSPTTSTSFFRFPVTSAPESTTEREEEWSETDIDDVYDADYDDSGSGSLETTGSGDSQDTATGSGHHISITDDEDYDDDFEVKIFFFNLHCLIFELSKN